MRLVVFSSLVFCLCSVGVFADSTADNFYFAGSFEIGERPVSLDVGDVTGDDVPDLISANVGIFSSEDGGFVGRTLSVFENDGSGSFSEYLVVDVDDVPESVAAADVDNDMLLDIVLATAGSEVTIFLNAETEFVEGGPYASGAVPISLVIAA